MGSEQSSNQVTREDVVGAVIGIGAGILLGLLGVAVIEALTKPKCPNCKKPVDCNTPYCQSCHAVLRWQ